MTTYKRTCIKDFEILAENGDHFEIKSGKEYLTSKEENGFVVVFTNFWVKVPIEYFTNEVLFTV